MPRGNASLTKVHFKGNEDDFIIFVESAAAVQKWKGDRSIPIADVVDGFKVFVTHKHGKQGILDTASHASLENQFGTHKEDDVILQILEKGEVQETEESGRQGDKNVTMGSRIEHGGSSGPK